MTTSRPTPRPLRCLAATLLASAAAGAAPPWAHQAPLYWSAYENNLLKENRRDADVHITEGEWRANIDWVDARLRPFGYTMVCIDGWGDVSTLSEHGYRTSHSRHWTHDYAWWSQHLQQRGMTLGMYGNPLWVHVAAGDTNTLIVGTALPVSSLRDPAEAARFSWVQIERPGAEAYVKGCIRFYAAMGVRFFRIDFLSWYEDGRDRLLGTVGPARPRAHYEQALRWMREAADESGMFLSLVMPHLHAHAELERRYGHMIRINEDTGDGGWARWSANARGEQRQGWSVYANPCDGLAYWSSLAGRGRVILDPDFIRLNTFANDDEKRSVISLCLLAGSPVAIADQVDTIGDDLWLYVNTELLALNRDGFVGAPRRHDPTHADSQIWTGRLRSGDWIVGLFNREDDTRRRGIEFAALGLTAAAPVRDLWEHRDLGTLSRFEAAIPPHGCKVLRISDTGASRVPGP